MCQNYLCGPFLYDELYQIYKNVDSFQTRVYKYDFFRVSIVLKHYNYDGIFIIVFETKSQWEFDIVCGHLLYMNKNEKIGRVTVQ